MNEELIKQLRTYADQQEHVWGKGDTFTAIVREAADALSAPSHSERAVPDGWDSRRYGYTTLFNAIAHAATMNKDGSLGISVASFENYMMTAAPSAPAVPAAGVDAEKVMALVLEYGAAKMAFGESRDTERGVAADELRSQIRALLAAPAADGGLRDLVRRMAIHLENPDNIPAIKWGIQGFELISEAEALLAAPAVPVGDGWQPIETAPKDGTPVVLAAKWERDPFIARWIAGEWWPDTSQLGIDGDATLRSDAPDADEIIGWQPLPASPAATKEG